MREIDGTKYSYENSSLINKDLNKKQSGLYSQLAYTLDEQWKVGLRYESIYQNDVKEDSLDLALANNFNKYSAMLEYKTSELSKFRFQYNKNMALYDEDGEKQNINTIILQVNILIGAHAGHEGHNDENDMEEEEHNH